MATHAKSRLAARGSVNHHPEFPAVIPLGKAPPHPPFRPQHYTPQRAPRPRTACRERRWRVTVPWASRPAHAGSDSSATFLLPTTAPRRPLGLAGTAGHAPAPAEVSLRPVSGATVSRPDQPQRRPRRRPETFVAPPEVAGRRRRGGGGAAAAPPPGGDCGAAAGR